MQQKLNKEDLLFLVYFYFMRKHRSPINQKTPKIILKNILATFTYDPLTGEIFNIKNKRFYPKKTKKGYRADIYIYHRQSEYYIKYHRLCWLLHHKELIADNLQIDHANNIKDDNRLENIRCCTNDDNSKKKNIRKDNISGFKGVSLSVETNKYGKSYLYFKVRISYPKGKCITIGRFKTVEEGAKYYDSAARFYYKEFALCNFEQQFIKPMSVEDLKRHKKNDYEIFKNSK